jgi:hypothetical protein
MRRARAAPGTTVVQVEFAETPIKGGAPPSDRPAGLPDTAEAAQSSKAQQVHASPSLRSIASASSLPSLMRAPSSKRSGRVLVHYVGWSAKWDEWIAFPSSRLAP